MMSPTASYINVPVYVPLQLVSVVNPINAAPQSNVLPLGNKPFLPPFVRSELSDVTPNGTPVTKYRKLSIRTQPREIEIKKRKRSYNCYVCGDVFSYKKTLTQHINVNHGEERPYECKECGDTFTEKIFLKAHVRQHKVALCLKNYNCDVCGVVLAGMITFRKHARTHVHHQFIQGNNAASGKSHSLCIQTESKKDELVKSVQPVEKIYKCSECGDTFKTIDEIKIHAHQHQSKDYNCVVCGATFGDTVALRKHIRRSHIEPLKCSACAATFNTKSQYRIHMRKHRVNFSPILPNIFNKFYTCTVCGAAFADSISFDKHKNLQTNLGIVNLNASIKQLTPDGNNAVSGPQSVPLKIEFDQSERIQSLQILKEPYTCNSCGDDFVDKGSLQSHISKVHNIDRPYKCKECGAFFKFKSRLVHHFYIHSTERSYKCDECGAAYKTRSALKSHARVHSGELPHKCKECGAAFSGSRSLWSHSKVHSNEAPHKCTKCSYAFKLKSNLQRHLRMHCGEKRYKCNECNSAFTMRRALRAHSESCACKIRKEKVH